MISGHIMVTRYTVSGVTFHHHAIVKDGIGHINITKVKLL